MLETFSQILSVVWVQEQTTLRRRKDQDWTIQKRKNGQMIKNSLRHKNLVLMKYQEATEQGPMVCSWF